ncbi:MAG: alanyl-tRNA editing protein, partial [Bacillota bacterium]|nr:alanyl-tRNA editing protein [Bacillota bacterium]
NLPLPKEGDTVHCRIDWARRFDNMQRHCGEHILSGVFYRLYGGVNRGFHMGRDYMTVDISLEEDPDFTQLTMDMALEAELQTNQVIWSDAPVTVLRFDSREEAAKMPLRKSLALDEDISIVSVGSIENAADCVACCGTHPSSAGQVGLLKIYKVEKYKNMFRVYFEAGQRALKDYDAKHRILTDLSNRYSSSIEDFPGKLKTQEEKLASLKDELFHLKKAFTELECAKLDALLEESAAKAAEGGLSENVLTHRLELFSMEDAFNMGKRYMGEQLIPGVNALIMLYSEKDTSFILVSSGEPDCGRLVKEYASFYQGKGGGNKVSARAIFASEENAMLFADLVTKHLKG